MNNNVQTIIKFLTHSILNEPNSLVSFKLSVNNCFFFTPNLVMQLTINVNLICVYEFVPIKIIRKNKSLSKLSNIKKCKAFKRYQASEQNILHKYP